MPKNRDFMLVLGGSADPVRTGSLQRKPLTSIDNFALSRPGKLVADRANYCKVISPLSPPQYQNSTLGPPIGSRPSQHGENLMPNEKLAVDRERRNLVAELERRRSKIAKAKSSFEVLIGAYDLVAADLRSAASGDRPATRGEATA
jgi:hypothetical protein